MSSARSVEEYPIMTRPLNKRKCFECKCILDLNTDNFWHSKKRGCRGFDQRCIRCAKARFDKFKDTKGSTPWGKRLEILERLGLKCKKCGLKNENPSFFDIDHIIPLPKNHGPRLIHLKNLQVLCPNCHRIKTLSEMKKRTLGPVR